MLFTLRLGSSFPDMAKSSVVFPELGGPRSSVILLGLTIPLTSLRIVTCFFLLERMWRKVKQLWKDQRKKDCGTNCRTKETHTKNKTNSNTKFNKLEYAQVYLHQINSKVQESRHSSTSHISLSLNV